MLSLTAISKAEKNKLGTGTAFLLLMEIRLATETIYIAHNNADVRWRDKLWVAFPFQLGEVSEATDGSDPQVELKVSNVSRALQYMVETSGGGVKIPVKLYIVNDRNLADPTPDVEEQFSVVKTTCDQDFITFTLGTEYSSRTVRPFRRYFKNFCPYRFKSVECGYDGELTTCPKTLTGCRARNNSKRYGGFIGIEQGGVYL